MKKNKTERTYQFEVKIISDAVISAPSLRKAKQILKDSWLEENNLELENEEISLISVVIEKDNKDGTKNITID